MKEEEVAGFINTILTELDIRGDWTKLNIGDILDIIKNDFNKKMDIFYKIGDQRLPDYIKYGDIINILGINDKIYILSFGEYDGISEPGSEECIGINYSTWEQILA